MEIIMTPQPTATRGNPLTVVSMITENVGKRYRSTVMFSDGASRISFGENAKTAERNALRDLNLDWSHFLPNS